ncbi:acyl-CoA dehydrogenase family protein [Amycolatopsis sp. NPDC026612]|uniref:acyl-CoA dehydrogenase family protein n=1 Tax=Amycolatopsis sp. NPDC026612 TaxID=3155466 RepID=UPI0033CA6B2D
MTVTEDREYTTWLAGLRTWAAHAADRPGAWRSAGAQGLFSLPVETGSGGAGAGYEATCRAIEAIAEETGESGLPFAMSAHLWACQDPLAAFGTAAQRTAYLGAAMSGELVGAFAATEYDAGSDLLSLRTTATQPDSGSWSLNGTKMFVTNGPIADLFLVLARTGEGSPLSALSAFLIPKSAAGLTVGPDIEKSALPDAKLSTLHLDNVTVPAEACLGGAGGGFAVLMRAMRIERAFILAPVLGLMARALRRAVEHVKTREQGGGPLSSYDTIRARIVRMHLSLTTARETLYGTARQADAGTLDHPRSSLTKLLVSREFGSFCAELSDVYGGYALLPETGVAQLAADAIASRYYSGTSDMQIKIIAEGLGL